MKLKTLVVIENHELFVGTGDLAEGFGVEHRALTKRVKKYYSEFLEFEQGIEALKVRQFQTDKAGKPFDEYLLNEAQATYLITLLTNNEKVRKFKMHLTKEFLRQRKLLNDIVIQRKNAEWIENRRLGIIERHTQTDVIKEFIEYAKSQGSQNADKYYMIITKMENSSLFHLELLKIKYSNLREIASSLGLASLRIADHIVAKALQEGMKERMYYKDIYLRAKARIESFADSMGKMEIESEKVKMIEG